MPRSSRREVGPRWSAQRRLEFIEFRLFWQGTLNRRDLREQFGISEQQASADIAAYQEAAPGNCKYDRNAKMYVTEKDFEPAFGPPDAQAYLNELRSVSWGLTTKEESRIGAFPSFATVRYPRRLADVEILRKVLRAIESGEALLVYYQSVSRPAPIWRWISPHALAYDGHRWHARAFCHKSGDFNDFVLGRILEAQKAVPHEVDPAFDRQWEEMIDLEIGIHPEVPFNQRAVIEMDHVMEEGSFVIPTRVALAYYLLRWMRADLDPSKVSFEERQVVPLNKGEIDRRSKELEEESYRLAEAACVVRLEVE